MKCNEPVSQCVRWLFTLILRTVNAWEMRQLSVAETPWYKDDLVIRQMLSSGPRGGSRSSLVWREGGMEPALYFYLSLSTEARQALSWRPLYRDVMSFTDF